MKLCMGCMNQMEDHLLVCPHCGFNEAALRQESYYLDPGTIIGGKYIAGRVMSYGGHTISYLGMDAEANRKVIIKEYLPSDFSTRSEGEKEVTIYSGDGQVQFEQGLTNFLNEANRIQQLGKAEGIAQVYDCIAENDTGYVISEYVEGKTLKEILDSGKKFGAEEAKSFILRILRGLSKIHKMNIVHCDISPETIMVTDSGEIKLMDFGATRYVTTANSKSLSIILKRGYAPEEQYRSRGVRGSWTDVYALGAVMYRMITGVVPQESVDRVLEDDLKEPSKMGISVPMNMENALMNALNVYQEERTPSAEIFLKELNSPSVKRIKVKKRNNKTGKFPIWAKGLVACLFCVAIAGGVILYRMSGEDTRLDSKAIILKDLKGMEVEKVQEYINSLNKDNGWNIKLDTEEHIFDLVKENNGTIYSQSVEPSTNLSDKTVLENIDDLQNENGKVTGTIKCTVYSNEKLYFSEISNMNAYALAKKLGIDVTDENRFIRVQGEKGNYYDLKSLQTEEEVINAEDLNKEENANKEINYNEGIRISYYASEFFYWKELDVFEGKKINDLPKYATYEYDLKNEKKRKKTGKEKSLKGTSLVDENYYSFEEEAGTIIEQTRPAGQKLDTSEGMEEALLYVIKERLTYDVETGRQVEDKVKKWNGVTVEFAGSKDSSQEAIGVSVFDDNGQEIKYFKKGQRVKIIITTKEIPEPEPIQENTPSNEIPQTPIQQPVAPQQPVTDSDGREAN
ncbi:protein kinase [Lachnospiraceae bacterium 48-42]